MTGNVKKSGNVIKTETATSEAKAYSIHHYSKGTIRDTRLLGKGAPKRTLENGEVLVKIERFIPSLSAPKNDIERVSEEVPGLKKKEVVLIYADGSQVTVTTKGQPKKFLNGSPLVKTLVRLPVSITKAEYETLVLPDATTKAYSVFVYSNGVRVSTLEIGSGRPASFKNGARLVTIEKHVLPKRLSKEERKDKKEALKKERVLVSPTELKLGDTFYHSFNKAPVKLISFIEGNDKQVIGEFALNGVTVQGKVLLSYLMAAQ